MAGGMRERGGCVGYDMGYHCIRVTTRSGGLSSSGPLVVCHTAHSCVHTYIHKRACARVDVVTREDVISVILCFPSTWFLPRDGSAEQAFQGALLLAPR